jgi:hypothetical protein
MEKRTITRLLIGGLVLVAAGAVVCAAAVGLMLAYGGTFTPATTASGGYEFVPRLDGFFWTMVGLCVLGSLAAVVGLLVQFVAWVGALVNTSKLVDKMWFAMLLVSGLLGLSSVLAPLGFAGMVAYVIAGPDGTAVELQTRTPAPRPGGDSIAPQPPTTLAPTS